MRRLLRCCPMLLLLLLTGCSGGNSAVPHDRASDVALFGLEQPAAASAEGLMGHYALELAGIAENNPTAQLTAIRKVQQNDDLTFLSIQDFLKPTDLSVDAIELTATELRLRYTVRHPFPAPADLDAPPNAFSNRADLGFSGRVLFLLPVDPVLGPIADFTFFGDVAANTALITNADGYYRPQGLIDSSLNTNTFPYKLVVDEAHGSEGNRLGVGNAGLPTGNFDPGNGGWHRDNIGASRGGWTGFDVLHQGQSATNSLILDRAILGVTPLRFEVAVIAKYQSPVDGATSAERKANRLPSSPIDPRRFMYRMPHGALDVGVVQFRGESGGLIEGESDSATTLRVTVRDWDALAVPTVEPNLADDANPSTTYSGELGHPALQVDVPTVSSAATSLPLTDDDSAVGGDPEPESGLADDPFYYAGEILNTALAGPGPKRGLLRVTDPAASLDRSAYEFALGPGLVPLTSNIPEPITYQALSVMVESGSGGNEPPTAVVELAGGPVPEIVSFGPLTFDLVSEVDAEGDAVTYSIDTTNDGDFELLDYDPAEAPPTILFDTNAPVNIGNEPVPYTARVAYADPAHVATPQEILLDYVVIPEAGGCLARIIQWDLDGTNQEWVTGSDDKLYNSDLEDKGGFTWGCHTDPGAQAAVAASGGALSGEFLVSSPDPDSCNGFADYGGTARYNIVSPVWCAPSICGTALEYRLKFNAFVNARNGAWIRAYISHNGGSEMTEVWSARANGGDQIFLNELVTLPDISGGTAVMVRFEFEDLAGSTYTGPDGYAGLMIDNVALVADGGLGDWFEPFTATVWQETFETGGAGWSAGALPNTDGMDACGSTWGGFAVCRTINDVPPVSGFAAVAGGDGGSCGVNAENLGSNASYNLVSPAIDLSAAAGVLVLYWDELKSVARGGYTFNLYLSDDGGASWGTPLDTFTATTPTATTVDSKFALINDAAGHDDVRLRFEVTTIPPTDPAPPADPNFCTGNGANNWTESNDFTPVDPIALDNLRIAYSK